MFGFMSGLSHKTLEALCGLGCILILGAAKAQAADRCSVRVSPIVFPLYDPLSPFDAQTKGALAFRCTNSTPIRMLAGPGRNGSVAARRMVRGSSRLHYGLFLDAAGATPWGDGSSGAGFYSEPGPAAGCDRERADLRAHSGPANASRRGDLRR